MRMTCCLMERTADDWDDGVAMQGREKQARTMTPV